MTLQEIKEAFQFIFDACVRLNDAQAVRDMDQEMLAEELTDIENVAGRCLVEMQGDIPRDWLDRFVDDRHLIDGVREDR